MPLLLIISLIICSMIHITIYLTALLGCLPRFFSSDIGQVILTRSTVVLILQFLDLIHHENNTYHIQNNDDCHETIQNHVHSGYIGKCTGNCNEDRIHKNPYFGEFQSKQLGWRTLS